MTNIQKTRTMRTLTNLELNDVSGGHPAAFAALAISGGMALFTYGRYLHSQNCDEH